MRIAVDAPDPCTFEEQGRTFIGSKYIINAMACNQNGDFHVARHESTGIFVTLVEQAGVAGWTGQSRPGEPRERVPANYKGFSYLNKCTQLVLARNFLSLLLSFLRKQESRMPLARSSP
ncbi:MAG: hypothetical protein OXR07_06910 [Nitrospira sp.]|nr:hypothetical protein [Nitrospira sp.]